MSSERITSQMRVEFFGIPRVRAGVAAAAFELPGREISLAQVLALLAERYPQLTPDCISNGSLGAGFTANVNGERFVRNPSTPIAAGETLLFFSTDAGG